LRGQIDRNERPEAGLHVGDEKDEPVEAAQAARRRRERRLAALSLRARRRRGLGSDPAASVRSVGKAA